MYVKIVFQTIEISTDYKEETPHSWRVSATTPNDKAFALYGLQAQHI